MERNNESVEVKEVSLPQSRAYQEELLEESIRRNIIIALDTGSGKTHIAVLRMRYETEKNPQKTCWFFAPTVGLCEQQKDVISTALPVSVGIISGADSPDQWTNKELWHTLISTHQIVVSTPQVFLDALRHGYVDMGREISLLVFDEAHHAVDDHPYNVIMKEFYHRIPAEASNHTASEGVRPCVLGLTASPMFGGDVKMAFEKLERNLDSVICSARQTREELSRYVHRPNFKHVFYAPTSMVWGSPSPSHNVRQVTAILESLNIEDDPYIHSLRRKLAKLPVPSPERSRWDQKLSKALSKQDTFTHKGLRDLHRTADEICYDLGTWAADWFVQRVVEKAIGPADALKSMFTEWQDKEKAYLLSALGRIKIEPVSFKKESILAGISPKVDALVRCLLSEKKEWDDANELYSGLTFVTRRDAVVALAELLAHHPSTKDAFSIGCLLGSSDNSQRRSLLDITRNLLKQTLAETLRDFRIGEKNLIVATAVAEEGIDIQACGSVIRWDIPQNMVSWLQSRGRARKSRSNFVLMFEQDGIDQKTVQKWHEMEQKMILAYLKEKMAMSAACPKIKVEPEDEEEEEEEEEYFTVEKTGAVLSLSSAVAHLGHFCGVIPSPTHTRHEAIYALDPPDYPFEFHLLPEHRRRLLQYTGPWGASVTLPRPVKLVNNPDRVFKTECIYQTKRSARKHAAFLAYRAVYEEGLLNDHLLPWTSVIEPELEEEVKKLLKDVEKRDGTANVSIQMNPWMPDQSLTEIAEDKWWLSELDIEGVCKVKMLTRVEIPIDLTNCDTLYDPAYGRRNVSIKSIGIFNHSDESIVAAKEYTRRLFCMVYGYRMYWDSLNFAYLFLSLDASPAWHERRMWADQQEERWGPSKPDNRYFVDAADFGEKFSYPKDIFLVRDVLHGNRSYEFVRWRKKRLSMNETIALMERFPITLDDEMTAPVVMAKALPKRMDFLVPLHDRDQQESEVEILPSQYTTIALAPASEIRVSMFLPSILRSLAVRLTTCSLRSSLFPTTLRCLPIDLLKEAHVAPVASEQYNYQRLETLGDGILKFLVSIQLLGEFPLWHEGYLTKRKDHVVSNACLARAAIKKHLYRWIIRERFTARKWTPELLVYDRDDGGSSEIRLANAAPMHQVQNNQVKDSDKAKYKDKPTAQLSTKLMADVVEAMIGAAYLDGGLQAGIECLKAFDLDVVWQSIPDRLLQLSERTDILNDPPSQLSYVEDIIGYTFSKKANLVEALIHASYHGDIALVSYERMEFLGDSVLDMIVTESLFRAHGKEYSPGQLHMRKSACVNMHFLGYICLRASTDMITQVPKADNSGTFRLVGDSQKVFLWQCILHSSSHILDDLVYTFARYEREREELEYLLEHSAMYPWATLTRLQAPKFFSDIIESLTGAVYLDSNGDIDQVKAVLDKLGILPILRRIVEDDVDVRHPISRVANWAAKNDMEVRYDVETIGGYVTVSLLCDDEEIISLTERYKGRASQQELKFRVAEEGIEILAGIREEYLGDM